MDNARLRVALAWVFGVVAVVFVVLGVTVSPVALGVGVPFGIAAYILWYQASGRLRARVRWRADAEPTGRRRPNDTGSQRGRSPGGRRSAGPPGDDAPAIDLGTAYEVLGVSPDADPATVRAAYRERVKEVHPDRGGDESTFKRVTRAYERLREQGRA
ncbi:MAG: J domain-containing protein [Halobacteriaceae archaeon]